MIPAFTFEEIKAGIESLPGVEIREAQPDVLQPWIELSPESMPQVCRWLKDTPGAWFDSLSCLTAIDRVAENQFGIVLHLNSIPYQKQFVLKAFQAKTESVIKDPANQLALPEFQSLSNIWAAAVWHEREAYDLMGIWFVGHPDLRRILMPEDWEGFPLRKDYSPAESYHEVKIRY